jgi:hypothetical protein
MVCDDFASVFRCFANVSDAYCSCFICLQTHVAMFHLDVSKVDQVLYMLQCDSPATVACCSSWGVVHVCEKWRYEVVRGCGRGERRGKRGERRGQSPPGAGVQQSWAFGRPGTSNSLG